MIHLPGSNGEVKAFAQSEVERRLLTIKALQRLRDDAFDKFVRSIIKVKE
jgi:hypothetical protein